MQNVKGSWSEKSRNDGLLRVDTFMNKVKTRNGGFFYVVTFVHEVKTE
jgi:hypothetical protein